MPEDDPMTLEEFASQLVRDDPSLKACYIAVMEAEDGYNLEVETAPGVIGGTYATNSTKLHYARNAAGSLDAILTQKGITVYKTRQEWEDQEE